MISPPLLPQPCPDGLAKGDDSGTGVDKTGEAEGLGIGFDSDSGAGVASDTGEAVADDTGMGAGEGSGVVVVIWTGFSAGVALETGTATGTWMGVAAGVGVTGEGVPLAWGRLTL